MKQEYALRRERLQEKLKAAGIRGMIITQNVDVYYFTGTMQSGFLFVPYEGESIFYVKKSEVRAHKEAYCKVEPLGSLRSFGERLAADFPRLYPEGQTRGPGAFLQLGAEFDVLPVQLFQRLQAAIPHAIWVDGSLAIRETRMLKSAYELGRLREAAALVGGAFEYALTVLREGMTELELVSRLEYWMRLQGHLGIMRMRGFNQEVVTGMVGSGSAAAAPTYFDGPAGGLGISPALPQSASRKTIARNEPILIDLGCCIDGYVIDQSRTVVIGRMEEELERAYRLAEEIAANTERLLKPDTSSALPYQKALELVKKAGLERHFMGFGPDQARFLGHGIGLEIDELPVLAAGFAYPLEESMVIAVEPKFTFPGKGVVGIENSYAITRDGFEKLTLTREGILSLP